MRKRVSQLDLRGQNGDGATAKALALLGNAAEPDLTRLLVIDDAAALAAHSLAFEELLRSRRLETLMCVAVGRPETELILPGSIGSGQGTGVIWALDPVGVNWRLAASAPATRREETEGQPDGLHHLIEILSLTEVFDQAAVLAAGVPGGVSVPGLRLAGVSGDQSEFLFTLAGAIDRLVEPTGQGPAAIVPGLLEPVPRPGPVRLRAGLPLATAFDRARRAVESTLELAGQLPQAGALFGPALPVQEYVAEAGTHVGDLQAAVEGLLTRASSTTELSAGQLSLIQDEGIILPDPPDFEPAKVRTALQQFLSSELDREAALPQLTEGLAKLEADLSPRGSAAYLPELRQACPAELVSRLIDPHPFPPPEPWLPVIGAVAAALAALSPVTLLSLAGGLVMAALWTTLVALTVARGPGGRLADQRIPLITNAVAAVVGAGAGGFLAAALQPPVPAWGVGVLLALCVSGVAAVRSWRARATEWSEESGLDAAGTAVENMAILLGRVAAEEWARVDARLTVTDAVTRIRVATESVGTRLQEYVRSLRADLVGVPQRMSIGDLDDIVRRQLGDLVLAALGPRLRELATGQPTVHGRLAREDTEHLIGEWEHHVEEHGAAEPPPFALEREQPAELLMTDDLTAQAQAAAFDPYEVMWQLCMATDLARLDVGSGPPHTVRFAPRNALTAIGDGLPNDMVWVSSTRYAGVLRLVPVRPGLVTHSWTGA